MKRLHAANLPRQMRSLQLQFVWSLPPLQYQHCDLERRHLAGMAVMKSSGSASLWDLATPPTQRKTSTVELHSFPRLVAQRGKASRIRCSANKRHCAHKCTPTSTLGVKLGDKACSIINFLTCKYPSLVKIAWKLQVHRDTCSPRLFKQ